MAAKFRGKKGQSLVELGLLLPFLLWICLGIIDFGRVYYYDNIAINAARSGARVAADYRNPPDPGGPVDSAVRADAGTRLQIQAVTVVYADPYHAAGTDVTVKVRYQFPLLTPLIGKLVGSPVVVEQSATMKMMY